MDNQFKNLKTGLAEMLCNGVIMDVTNVEQARTAEDAGAVSVMALERVPADIRKYGGVARMSDPEMIENMLKGMAHQLLGANSMGQDGWHSFGLLQLKALKELVG